MSSSHQAFWTGIVDAWGSRGSEAPAIRARKQRVPSDQWLFVNGLSGITSFMAARGILNLDRGFLAYRQEAKAYYGAAPGQSLESYARKKVLEKARRFNTMRTRIPDQFEKAQIKHDAERYKKASDGE